MRLARFHNLFRTAMVLGYVLLGIATVWHAPHFSQAHQSIDIDRHEHHEAVFEGGCALCTVKTSPQQSVARFGHGPFSLVAFSVESFAAPFAATIPTLSGRPRGPPTSLS